MSKSNSKTQIVEEFIRILGSPTNRKINLHVCNNLKLPRDFDYTDRINSIYHIAYVRKGEGCYIYDGVNDWMEEGKLYFFTSGYKHSRWLNKNNLPQMILIRCGIMDTSREEVIEPMVPFGFSFKTDNSTYMTLFCHMANQFKEVNNPYRHEQCETLLHHILFLLARDLSHDGEDRVVDLRIDQVKAYIHENLQHKITIGELSDIAKLSPNYFRQKFRHVVGCYPKAYIINRRVEKAVYLLQETDYSITDIAEKLGYSDLFSFSKQFKEKTGYSPTDFRNFIQKP